MQLTVKGILSFPHVFQPRAVEQGQDPKYSCTVLIPKNDPQIAQIQQAIETEKANGFPSGFPANAKLCLRDCAETAPGNAELAGYYELRTAASADSKPHVVDMNTQPIMDLGKVYAGAVAWVAVNTFAYNKAMSKGIAAGLNGIMVTGEEGPLGRLDNKPSAEQLFGNIAQGAPQQSAASVPPSASGAPPSAPTAPPAPPAAPVQQPQFPPEGWTAHPDAAGYFYCGQEVLSEQQLRAKFNIVQPSFA